MAYLLVRAYKIKFLDKTIDLATVKHRIDWSESVPRSQRTSSAFLSSEWIFCVFSAEGSSAAGAGLPSDVDDEAAAIADTCKTQWQCHCANVLKSEMTAVTV